MARLIKLWALASFVLSATALDIRLGVKKSLREVDKEVSQRRASALNKRDIDPTVLYPAYNFSAPIDHFHNESIYAPHTNGTFNLRYWFDATSYKPGGPVIVLQSGEASGDERLPYLQKGIVAQLAQATNGIGVVLEHRYYGTSIPTPDFSTENLRFLTTAQALADVSTFAQNVKFPGLEEYGDLTSKNTAWISYGGSYAGAFSAFLRVQYPDVFWGSISSSGVTKAIWDYWAYFETMAEKAPQACMTSQRSLISFIDAILVTKGNTTLTRELKETFGFAGLSHDSDFASQFTNGIGNWQSLNWDPAVTSNEFYNYCDNITSSSVLYPETEAKRANVTYLLSEAGCESSETSINQLLNVIGYFNLTEVAPCLEDGATLDECFSSYNASFYQQDSLDSGSWRSWPYQYCTEWGFLQTSHNVNNGTPIVSRKVDLEYESLICRYAFNITGAPDVDAVNKYGGYDISYERLAIIDGDWDPWKDATPHAFEFGAKQRNSTLSEPFILIPESVHHWDENGLFPNQTTASLPPQRIKKVQSQEAQFVRAWMKEWQAARYGYGGSWPHGGGNGGWP